MLDLLTLCTKKECNTPPVLNETNWGTTAKIWLVAILSIERNYISILIWSNFGAIWLVSCSFGHYNILQTDCLVSRVPTIYVLSRNIKKNQNFYLIFFYFCMVKFSVYLNRLVFVMFLEHHQESRHSHSANFLLLLAVLRRWFWCCLYGAFYMYFPVPCRIVVFTGSCLTFVNTLLGERELIALPFLCLWNVYCL